MKKVLNQEPFDLYSLTDVLSMSRISDDFLLLDDIKNVPFFEQPTKFDMAIAAVCLTGCIEGSIDMKRYTASAQSFFLVLPDQMLQFHRTSEDFSGLFFIASKRFIANLELNIKDASATFIQLHKSPITALSQQDFALVMDYYQILKKTAQMTDNASRKEIVRFLVQAMFYGLSNIWRQEDGVKLRKKAMFDAFCDLIMSHYKESRELTFYADKLNRTPRYLSALIKEVTGRTATRWINHYVILQAKLLLKSTDMTIQEISNDLNFANQSCFGKYFKQNTGMAPSDYREGRD
jgi:AraC-like DNA-binding protein